MKKWFPVLGIIFLIVGLIVIGYQFRDRFQKKPAGLEINATPSSAVYLNDKLVGQTPYSNKSVSPGTYTLKLVPDPGGQTSEPWQTHLDLNSLVTTVVNHSFAPSEIDSSGSILQLNKEPGGKTYLSLISNPDTVNVTIDNQPSGFTPLTKIEISPGSHSLEVTSPGYKPQTLTVNTIKGYNLIVNVKLAVDQLVLSAPVVATNSAIVVSPSPTATVSAQPSPIASPIAKPYVVVKETGTGWLRVRKEPSATADELGKANVGEKLKYLGESTETGWYKIEFEKQTGWVSGKYTDLIK